MVPIKPVGYAMLVKQVVQENVSAGGILLSTDEETKRQQAGFPIYEVLALGSACYKNRGDGTDFDEGAWCKVGDRVFIGSYAGVVIQPKEFESKYKDDAEALAELKDMARLNLKFHIVNDDNVRAVL